VADTTAAADELRAFLGLLSAPLAKAAATPAAAAVDAKPTAPGFFKSAAAATATATGPVHKPAKAAPPVAPAQSLPKPAAAAVAGAAVAAAMGKAGATPKFKAAPVIKPPGMPGFGPVHVKSAPPLAAAAAPAAAAAAATPGGSAKATTTAAAKAATPAAPKQQIPLIPKEEKKMIDILNADIRECNRENRRMQVDNHHLKHELHKALAQIEAAEAAAKLHDQENDQLQKQSDKWQNEAWNLSQELRKARQGPKGWQSCNKCKAWTWQREGRFCVNMQCKLNIKTVAAAETQTGSDTEAMPSGIAEEVPEDVDAAALGMLEHEQRMEAWRQQTAAAEAAAATSAATATAGHEEPAADEAMAPAAADVTPAEADAEDHGKTQAPAVDETANPETPGDVGPLAEAGAPAEVEAPAEAEADAGVETGAGEVPTAAATTADAAAGGEAAAETPRRRITRFRPSSTEPPAPSKKKPKK